MTRWGQLFAIGLFMILAYSYKQYLIVQIIYHEYNLYRDVADDRLIRLRDEKIVYDSNI